MDCESATSCWICLQGETDSDEALVKPCSCPRHVHMKCLSRWQLAQAGKWEQDRCRFCANTLPPLESSLASALPDHVQAVAQTTIAYMAVVFQGEMYKIPVRSGIEGMAEFRARVKCLFGFPYDTEFDVSFECASPATGEKLQLKGINSFSAAAACAKLSAAKRAAGEGGTFEWCPPEPLENGPAAPQHTSMLST